MNSFIKLYNANVYYADLIVKKIIDILNKFNLLNNTYLIITSDHGEHLGEKDLWEHHTRLSVYESVIRVPLILYHSSFKKKIINEQVELKNLFDTILHLTDIPTEKNIYLQIENSLLYRIKNGKFADYIFGEYLKSSEEKRIIQKYRKFIRQNLILKIISDIRFLRTKNFKYINYGNRIEEFYDLINDPNENTNIFNKNNEICQKMRNKLIWMVNENKKTDKLKIMRTKREKSLIKDIIKQKKFKI